MNLYFPVTLIRHIHTQVNTRWLMCMFQLVSLVWKTTKKLTSFESFLWRQGGDKRTQFLFGLVQRDLAPPSTQFEQYFPAADNPRIAKKWIYDPIVNIPGKLTKKPFAECRWTPGVRAETRLFETTYLLNILCYDQCLQLKKPPERANSI